MAQTHTLQQIQMMVDQIRLTVMSEQFDDTPEIRTLSREFAELSKALNHRLRQCGELLRQGLRSEAIESAETEPRLLDAVGVVVNLSDEELQSWQDLCEFLELTRPEPMLNDAALMLDSAYEEHEPLENLLRLHRRLALQRAPLSKRLATLRILAREDPGTEFWEEDIDKYEKARHAQIQEDLRKLKKSPSAANLTELKNEVESSDWKNPVPKKIIVMIRELLHNSSRDEARGHLKQAEESLREAFAEMNFPKAKPAYELWLQNWPLAEMANDDPLAIEAIPALSWCEQSAANEAEETEWSRTLSRVETLLDRKETTLLDFERISDEVDRFERPLPNSLGNRLQTRIASLRLRKSRQRLLIIVGSTVATIAIASLVTVVVLEANESRFRNEILARVQEFVDQGDVNRATELLGQYEGRWNDSSNWIDTVTSVDELQSKIDDRAHRLESIILEARAVPDRDDKTFDELKTQASSIVNEQPIVQQIVDQMELDFRNLKSERVIRLQKIEAGLFERLKAQSQQYDDLKLTVAEMEVKDFETRTQRMKEALSIIEQEAAGMSPQIRDQSQLLMTNINDLSGQVYREIRKEKLLKEMATLTRANLKNSKGTMVKFTELLGKLNEITLDEAKTKELQRAIEDAVTYQALEAFCNTFAMPEARLFPTASAEITSRKKDVTDYLEKYPNSPLISTVNDYAATLDVLWKRHGDSSSLIERTRMAAIDDFAMKNLYIIKVEGLKWPYYLTEYQYFQEPQVVEISSYRQDRQPQLVRLNANKLIDRKTEAAPQKALADKLDSLIEQTSFNNWESTYGAMTDAVVSENGVDPILKLRLLMILQIQAKEGSLTLENHQPFQAYVKQQTDTAQKVNLLTQWPDPDDQDVMKRRKLAEEYVEMLRVTDALKEIWKSSKDELESQAKELNLPYQSIGWMKHDEGGEPILDIDIPENGKWNIVICRSGDDETKPSSLRQIGHCSGGKAVIPEETLKYEFCPCRIVFAYPILSN